MCAVFFEFKPGGVSLSSCSIRIVHFSGAVGKTFSCDDAGPGSILARKDFFLNTVLSLYYVLWMHEFSNSRMAIIERIFSVTTT